MKKSSKLYLSFILFAFAISINIAYSQSVAKGVEQQSIVSATDPCPRPYGSATFTKVDATCAGTSTGSITIQPTVGLVSDYTYKLHYSDPYVASNVFTNLKSGIYHGYALRNGGCVYRAGLITVSNSNVLISATTSKTDVTCKGACDGTITVTASGGSGSYLYQHGSTGPKASNTITGLCAGTYRVIITDSGGCSKPYGISVTITQPTTPCGNNIIPLSGLRLWLKADAGVTKDSSNLVSQWNDQSGNNYIATQANNDTMPLWVDNVSNGKPFLRFNGTSDFFRTNFKGMGGTELTFFIVAKGNNLQSIIRLQTQHLNGNGDPNIVYPYTLSDSSFGFIVQDPHTNSISNIPSGLPNNTLAIGCARYKANATNGMQAFVNQTMFAQTTPTTTLPYEPLYIGQYNGNGLGGTQFTNGDVAEIIIYNRAVNETERESITNYLMTKYGITAKSNNKLNYAKLEPTLSQAKKITIYPNPATDRFTLQLSNYKPGKAEIVLTNQSGQIVERHSINVSSSINNTVFSMDKKATGICFVKVITAEGVQVRKVVIQDR